MDVAALRAEIKSWERAFKSQNRKEPTIEDIKAQPKIAAKYKLYKKLSKETPSKSFPKTTNVADPSTPPHRTSALPGPSGLVPKSRATAHSTTDATPNPFSPTKSPRKTRVNPDDVPHASSLPNFMKPPSTPPSKKRVFSTPSPEPLAPAEVTAEPTSSFVNSTIKKARKRLRGDLVSPSPKKPRVASAHHGLDDNAHEDEEADTSYVDESPVKPTANGKNFKLLFEEERLPRLDLTTKSGPFSRSMSKATLFDKPMSTVSRSLLTERADGPPKPMQLQGRSKTLSNLKERSFTRLPFSKVNTYEVLRSSSRDFTSGDAPDVHDEGSSRASRKRSSSVDVDDVSVNDKSFLRVGSGLLPPSPPPAPNQTGPNGMSGKGHFKNRKKAKLATGAELDDTSFGDERDLQIVDVDLRAQRHKNSRHVYEEEDDLFLEGFGPIDEDRYTGIPEVSQDQIDRDEPQVSLPDDLREVLHISSSHARGREERALVDSLLRGRPGPQDQHGEVWGIGEIEDGAAATTDGEDEWDGEGVPWEVGEL